MRAPSRWPPVVALAALLAFAGVLPERYGLLPGWAKIPIWLLVGLVFLISYPSARVRSLARPVTIVVLGVATALMVAVTVRLIYLVYLEGVRVCKVPLLSTAAALWASNLVLFSIWYWLLDSGGPERRQSGSPGRPELTFPQTRAAQPPARWSPGFLDYVFVAFAISVAFNPSDATPLSTRAKLLTMTQSSMSLVTIVLVAARAVNILG